VLTPIHHPLHIAAKAATLDLLSNGRVDPVWAGHLHLTSLLPLEWVWRTPGV